MIALFEASRALIPENIHLKLLHFDGDNINSLPDVEEKAVIIGAGEAHKEYKELVRRLGKKLDTKRGFNGPRSKIGRVNELYCKFIRSGIRQHCRRFMGDLFVNALSPLQVEFNTLLDKHSLDYANNEHLTHWHQQVSGPLGGRNFSGVSVPHTVERLMHHIERIDRNWYVEGYYKKSLDEIVSELSTVMHSGISTRDFLGKLGLFSLVRDTRSCVTQALIDELNDERTCQSR